MFGGMNPKKMQEAMKKLGIKQENIDAERVIIEKTDGKVVINNPSITKINMQGQENFQITGEIQEDNEEENQEQDIQQIMEKTGKTLEEVKKALEESGGDLAEAIISLS